MDREAMQRAAKDVNEVLGLKPPIDTAWSDDKLKSELTIAAGLVEPTDKLIQETVSVLAELTGEKETQTTADTAEQTEVSGDALRDQVSGTKKLNDLKAIAGQHNLFCDINLDEYKGLGAQNKLKEDMLAKLPKSAPVEKAPRTPRAPKEPAMKKPSRAECVGTVLKSVAKIGFEALVQSADAMYVENGGKSNERETQYAAMHAIQFGVGYGILRQEDKDIIVEK